MKVSGVNGKEKGGVTIPLFHCIFNGDESVTHFMREYDASLYQTLPHLYAVCIARTVNKTKTVSSRRRERASPAGSHGGDYKFPSCMYHLGWGCAANRG
jgi:hypothetical protein